MTQRASRPVDPDAPPPQPALKTLRRVFHYLGPYKWRMAGTVSLYMACVAIAQIYPFIDRVLIDQHIAVGRIDGEFYLLVAIAVILHLINYAGFAVRTLSIVRISQRVLFDLRRELFRHVERLSFDFFESWPVGKIMARFQSDVTTLNEFLTNQLASIFHDAMSAMVVIAFMLAIDAGLAVVALLTLPALVGAALYLRPRMHAGWEAVREYATRFNIFLAENIAGMRVIQAFVREQVNFGQFIVANNQVVERWMKVISLNAWLGPIVEMTRAFGLAAVLYVAAHQIGATSTLTVGTLVAFAAYINALWGPISTFTNSYIVLQATLASAEKVFELLDTQPAVRDAPNAIAMPRVKGEIVFDHVWFSYDGSRMALKDITLRIPPGQLVALVGQTGSGKTTIASLVSRFYDVTQGRILIDGIDVRSVTQESLRRQQIAVVLQEPFIFTDTIANNIRYGRPAATMDEIIAAAKLANCHEFIDKLPEGYNTLAHERGSQFSLGQRQLMSIARAILADTPILILDEATSAVDTETEQLIQQALERLMAGRTSIVIAHRLSTIRKADQIVVLREGQIVEIGDHQTLASKADGYYARLVRAQMLGEH
ncbi:MAG: ABC transporter ATP-binding protein [Candidatus Roseilinea sp.]|uniref:ABC transporter ATP-binding protein n=1 Tax=Candidatus Roseilinea sp. TaxID=2838777 RepID=UPI004049B2A6